MGSSSSFKDKWEYLLLEHTGAHAHQRRFKPPFHNGATDLLDLWNAVSDKSSISARKQVKPQLPMQILEALYAANYRSCEFTSEARPAQLTERGNYHKEISKPSAGVSNSRQEGLSSAQVVAKSPMSILVIEALVVYIEIE